MNLEDTNIMEQLNQGPRTNNPSQSKVQGGTTNTGFGRTKENTLIKAPSPMKQQTETWLLRTKIKEEQMKTINMEELSKTLEDAEIVKNKLINLTVEVEHFRDIICDLTYDINKAYENSNVKIILEKQTLLKEVFDIAQQKSPFKEILTLAVSLHKKTKKTSAGDLLTVRG